MLSSTLPFLLVAAAIPKAIAQTSLTTSDQLTIVNQINLHQTYIDADSSYASAVRWLSLYWPEATFTANDKFGTVSRTGADPINDDGIKYLYDFDHSVFPLSDWFHSLGPHQFVDFDGSGTPVYNAQNQTRVHWRWRVDWKVNTTGQSASRTSLLLCSNKRITACHLGDNLRDSAR